MFHFGLYHILVTDVWKGIHVPINGLNIIYTHFEAIKNNKFILVNGPDIHNNINECFFFYITITII